mmetsp:Transcript_110453/g.237685  ORF Transcript_110453/g.237685 Transcript_110453/m.237685 type:complete len:211 (+) Transcript_110453:431-1063(+)
MASVSELKETHQEVKNKLALSEAEVKKLQKELDKQVDRNETEKHSYSLMISTLREKIENFRDKDNHNHESNNNGYSQKTKFEGEEVSFEEALNMKRKSSKDIKRNINQRNNKTRNDNKSKTNNNEEVYSFVNNEMLSDNDNDNEDESMSIHNYKEDIIEEENHTTKSNNKNAKKHSSDNSAQLKLKELQDQNAELQNEIDILESKLEKQT